MLSSAGWQVGCEFIQWDSNFVYPKSVLKHCSLLRAAHGNYDLVPSFYPAINYDLVAFVWPPIMIIFNEYLAGSDRSFHWARWLAAKILPIISADFAPIFAVKWNKAFACWILGNLFLITVLTHSLISYDDDCKGVSRCGIPWIGGSSKWEPAPEFFHISDRAAAGATHTEWNPELHAPCHQLSKSQSFTWVFS